MNKDGYIYNEDCVLYLQENGEMSNADQKTRNGKWKILLLLVVLQVFRESVK